jgi:hypothetical protein
MRRTSESAPRRAVCGGRGAAPGRDACLHVDRFWSETELIIAWTAMPLPPDANVLATIVKNTEAIRSSRR